MNKQAVLDSLKQVHEARERWAYAQTKFASDTYAIMRRLIHEATMHRMSPEQVAAASGFTVKRVRQMMRSMDLNPRDGRTLLSTKAAEALATNAELMGIEPSDFDLMSPLAYLPMGSELRRDLHAQAAQTVEPSEFLETEEIERWADDHFTQGEVAVILRLVEDFGWRPPVTQP